MVCVWADCPSGWQHVDSSCYGVVEESSGPLPSVYEARQLCLQHGADLASIPDDNTTFYNITSMITDMQPTQVHLLGLHRDK